MNLEQIQNEVMRVYPVKNRENQCASYKQRRDAKREELRKRLDEQNAINIAVGKDQPEMGG